MITKSTVSWETIESFDELIAIQKEWEEFNLKYSIGTPLFPTTWFITWINIFWKNEWELKVLVGRVDGSIFTIVPMYIQNTHSFFSKKILYPVGIGEPETQEIFSEYIDIIVAPSFEELVFRKVKQWILNLKVDAFFWRASLNNSNVIKIFKLFNKNTTKLEATRYLVHGSNWTPKNLSKNMRSRYRRGLNQLDKLNAKISWAEQGDFDHYWQLMKDLHQQRWLGKKKKGAFCSNEFNTFHTSFRKESPESIAMSAIWINDKPIAIHYYFSDVTTLYFYQSGWNDNEYSHLSPGLILHLWSIENNNKAYYDFMMGKKQDSYKAKFATEQQPMYNITIIFSPIKLLIHRVLKKLKLVSS